MVSQGFDMFIAYLLSLMSVQVLPSIHMIFISIFLCMQAFTSAENALQNVNDVSDGRLAWDLFC